MSDHRLDLEAYFGRIQYHGRRCVHPTVLAEIHEAHVAAIPFENLDVLLRRPIRLDGAALEAKLVRSRRGGYCFEQNELFAQALLAEGFAVARLAARVRYGSPGSTRERTWCSASTSAGSPGSPTSASAAKDCSGPSG
jgi:N-hydroxyarylamine O-acetyltransferase